MKRTLKNLKSPIEEIQREYDSLPAWRIFKRVSLRRLLRNFQASYQESYNDLNQKIAQINSPFSLKLSQISLPSLKMKNELGTISYTTEWTTLPPENGIIDYENLPAPEERTAANMIKYVDALRYCDNKWSMGDIGLLIRALAYVFSERDVENIDTEEFRQAAEAIQFNENGSITYYNEDLTDIITTPLNTNTINDENVLKNFLQASKLAQMESVHDAILARLDTPSPDIKTSENNFELFESVEDILKFCQRMYQHNRNTNDITENRVPAMQWAGENTPTREELLALINQQKEIIRARMPWKITFFRRKKRKACLKELALLNKLEIFLSRPDVSNVPLQSENTPKPLSEKIKETQGPYPAKSSYNRFAEINNTALADLGENAVELSDKLVRQANSIQENELGNWFSRKIFKRKTVYLNKELETLDALRKELRAQNDAIAEEMFIRINKYASHQDGLSESLLSQYRKFINRYSVDALGSRQYFQPALRAKTTLRLALNVNPDEKSCLVETLKHDRKDIVDNLLALGVSINEQDTDGNTALHHWVKCMANDVRPWNSDELKAKHLAIGDLLFQYNIDPNIQNESGNTGLHVAVRFIKDENICLDVVNLLINNGASVQLPNAMKELPIHFAAEYRFEEWNIRIFDLLLTSSTDSLQSRDQNECTPLLSACSVANYNAVVYFHEKHPTSLLDTTEPHKRTPLHLVAISKASTVNEINRLTVTIEYLVEKGAQFDAVDFEDNTPLHLLLKTGGNKCNTEIIQLLLSKAPHLINMKNNKGETALLLSIGYAAKVYYKGILERLVYLLTQGASLEETDNNGNTILHKALAGYGPSPEISCALKVAQFLLEKAPHLLEYKNSKGETPLLVAAKHHRYDVVHYLLKNKLVTLNEVDATGNSALLLASVFRGAHVNIDNCSKTIDVLLKNGASAGEKNHLGKGPLHLIAACTLHAKVFDVKYASFIKKLLESGASFQDGDHEGNTPIFLAAMARNFNTVHSFYNLGARLDEQNEKNLTLFDTIFKNTSFDHSAIREAVYWAEQGARINNEIENMPKISWHEQKDDCNKLQTTRNQRWQIASIEIPYPQYHFAACKGDLGTTVQFLTRNKAFFCQRNQFDVTPLYVAARESHWPTVFAYLVKAANGNLHEATAMGYKIQRQLDRRGRRGCETMQNALDALCTIEKLLWAAVDASIELSAEENASNKAEESSPQTEEQLPASVIELPPEVACQIFMWYLIAQFITPSEHLQDLSDLAELFQANNCTFGTTAYTWEASLLTGITSAFVQRLQYPNSVKYNKEPIDLNKLGEETDDFQPVKVIACKPSIDYSAHCLLFGVNGREANDSAAEDSSELESASSYSAS